MFDTEMVNLKDFFVKKCSKISPFSLCGKYAVPYLECTLGQIQHGGGGIG